MEIELDSRCNVFVGANGAGKTSLLESVHVLSCGRSFRTHRLSHLIRNGSTELLVVGDSVQNAHSTSVGIRVTRDHIEAHIAGAKVKGMADLAANLPLYLIDPNVHRVLEDGPEIRRRLIDRGLFHVEPGFIDAWRLYQRALKQRNAILKAQGRESEIKAWEPHLVQAGNSIDACRKQYVDQVRPLFQRVAGGFFIDTIDLEIESGWKGPSFGEELERNRQRDRRVGSTTAGPHRADLRVSIGGQAARQIVSRGQQKLLSASIILAQVAYLASKGAQKPCLLLDDPGAELDVDNFERLLSQIEQIDAQLMVTGLDASVVARKLSPSLFHVEQGRVSPLL